MKFVAQLEYVEGCLRSGQLVGELSEADYAEWLTMSPEEQRELFWDVGNVEITSYRINNSGPIVDITWESQPSFTKWDDPLAQGKKRK